MTDDPEKKIEDLFHAALEREPLERSAFLDRTCAGDVELRREVDSLLAAHDEAFELPLKPAWGRFMTAIERDDAGSERLAAEPSLPFERLGDFRLIRRLGEGGMGVVYLAVQESLGRQVALKVIRPERTGSFEAEARFRREVEAVADLHHPNIVKVFGAGEDQGVRFFAMELLRGKGLDEVLSGAPDPIPVPQILAWIRDTARALESAHAAGLIHRDVKPSNIHITPEGDPMLMDFGVAHHVKLATLTLTGEFRGTPHYASPEQVRAKREHIDARSDIYSLGATLYEAVTGRVPFDGETTEQVFHQILVQDPPPPRRLNPMISRDMETVIMKAMEKDPGRRYRTMGDFAADLDRLLAVEPIAARPAGWSRKTFKWFRRHRFLSLSAAALLLVFAAWAIMTIEIARQRRIELSLARERFKPANEALKWNEERHHFTWQWCLETDPGDPAGYMLKALCRLRDNEPAEAVPCLEECIARCRERHEAGFEKDANYLLGISKLASAGDGGTYSATGSSDSGDRRSADGAEADQQLVEEAGSLFELAGAFDPLSPETFVWRDGDMTEMSPGSAREAIRNIRINEEHFLAELYRGLYTFHDLYRGGIIQDFEITASSFDRALAIKPDNVIALTFLGRTYYFYVRYHDFLDLTDRAEEYLQRALQCSAEHPNHVLLNTLGTLALVRGDDDKALDYNMRALQAAKAGNPGNIHNAYSGIGKIHTRQGRYEEACRSYMKAIELQSTDVPAKVGLAELLLLQGDTDKALQIALDALAKEEKRLVGEKSEYSQPAAFLINSRVCLARKDHAAAEKYLHDLYFKAIFSPRHFSQGIFMIATFPEERIFAEDGKTTGLQLLAWKLTGAVEANNRPGDRPSPICLSARGVGNYYLRGKYAKAIDHLTSAMRERNERWPADILAYHWTENARDLYFLAMAHHRAAAAADGGGPNAEASRSCFEQAEALYENNVPPIESADLIERVRNKAREVLGITQ